MWPYTIPVWALYNTSLMCVCHTQCVVILSFIFDNGLIFTCCMWYVFNFTCQMQYFFIFYCWGNSLKDFETLYGKCRSRKMAYVLMSKLLNDGLCSKTARVMREDCRSHNHRSPLNNCVIRRWKRMHKSAFLITHFWTIIV